MSLSYQLSIIIIRVTGYQVDSAIDLYKQLHEEDNAEPPEGGSIMPPAFCPVFKTTLLKTRAGQSQRGDSVQAGGV